MNVGLILRAWVGCLVQLAIIWLLLILPAGLIADAWDWPRGWQLIRFYGAILAVSVVVLAQIAPGGLQARMRVPYSPQQSAEDKRATALLISGLALGLLFMPFDVMRWQLLGVSGPMAATLGGWLALAGYGLCLWVIYSNSYSITFVEDQSASGQTLVDWGPYKLVRHPMYLGFLLIWPGVGLWLGSLASVLLIVPLFILLIPRVRIEERTLLETLPGYRAFSRRTRWRILPFVW